MPYWAYKFATAGYGNPSRQFIRTRDTYPDYVTQRESDYPLPLYVDFPPGISLPSYRPLFTSLQSQALTAALAELGSATAELGVELKEARKTAGYVSDKISVLVQSIQDIRKGKFLRGKRVRLPTSLSSAERAIGKKIGGVANAWLEYRYAVSPLILGVNDALRLLDEATAKPVLVTARKRASETDQSMGDWVEEAPLAGLYIKHRTQLTVTKSVYVVVTAQARSDIWTRFNDAGILNPASVWWETVPFSFVVDWFVNVGDFINARMALLLYNIKGCTATHRHEWKTTRDFLGDGTPNGWPLCFGPLDGVTATAGGTSFNRVVLRPEDVPSSLGIHVDNGLNLKRAADALALGWNLLTGRPASKTFRL